MRLEVVIFAGTSARTRCFRPFALPMLERSAASHSIRSAAVSTAIMYFVAPPCPHAARDLREQAKSDVGSTGLQDEPVCRAPCPQAWEAGPSARRSRGSSTAGCAASSAARRAHASARSIPALRQKQLVSLPTSESVGQKGVFVRAFALASAGRTALNGQDKNAGVRAAAEIRLMLAIVTSSGRRE